MIWKRIALQGKFIYFSFSPHFVVVGSVILHMILISFQTVWKIARVPIGVEQISFTSVRTFATCVAIYLIVRSLDVSSMFACLSFSLMLLDRVNQTFSFVNFKRLEARLDNLNSTDVL